MAAWDDKTIEGRSSSAEQQRAANLPYIERCHEMVSPWRLNGGRASAAAFEKLFDATGAIQHQRSAARLQSAVTPPLQRWFELEAGPLVPEDVREELNRQLEPITALIHATLDASAFHIASIEAYGDLLIGTSALLATEGDDHMPIKWQAAAAHFLAIENGPGGRADNVYFKRKYPAWILDRHWPGAHWSSKTSRLIGAKATDEIEVRQSSYFDEETRTWRMAVQELETDGSPVVWDKNRDRTNPWIITRYWTSPGDPWGRGPVMLALPDIRTANKTVEMLLTSAAYQLAPPLMVAHDGVVNPDTMTLNPRGLIRVSRTGGPMGPSIAPLMMGGNIDVGQIVLQEMRDQITKNLFGTSLPPPSGAVRSASEIIERTRDLAADQSAAFGRLNHEHVPQVVARVIDVLDRMKVAGFIWDQLRIDHFIMRVKLTSPLARAQNLEDVQTIAQFSELAVAIGGKEAFMVIANTEDGLPRLAKLMGVPMWFIRNKQARAALAESVGQLVAANIAQGGSPADALTSAAA